MLVTGGEKRGFRLKTPSDYDTTRPATSRLKKAMFDMIGDDIVGADVLDLYSGTGAISIEALSRGANRSILVDLSDEARELINYNLNKTDFLSKAIYYQEDIFKVVDRLIENGESFNYIFVDPPYDSVPEEDFFIKLLQILKDDGVLFVESRVKTDIFSDNHPDYIYHKKYYGKTKLSIMVHR